MPGSVAVLGEGKEPQAHVLAQSQLLWGSTPPAEALGNEQTVWGQALHQKICNRNTQCLLLNSHLAICTMYLLSYILNFPTAGVFNWQN